MPTRFYLSNLSGGFFQSVITGFSPGWTTTGEAGKYYLSTISGESIRETGTVNDLNNGANNRSLDRVYISNPLASGLVSGYVSGQLMVREYAANDDVNQVVISCYLTDRNGNLRGRLLNLNNYGTILEFANATTHRNHMFVSGTGRVFVNPVTGDYGDRLVLEIGYNATAGGTNPQASAIYGGNGLPNLPHDNSTATFGQGWFDLSTNLNFLDTKSQTGLARITASNIRYQSGLARINVTQTINQFTSGKSRISNTYNNWSSGLSRLSIQSSLYQEGYSRILDLNTGQNNPYFTLQSTDSNWYRISGVTEDSTTYLSVNQYQSYPNENSKPHLVLKTSYGSGYIVYLDTTDGLTTLAVEQSPTGGGEIEKLFISDNGTTHRLTVVSGEEIVNLEIDQDNIYDYSQRGVANITQETGSVTNVYYISGLSRVTATQLEDQTGLARITNSLVYSETGIARITASSYNYITGLSRVTNSFVYNESGKSRIQASYSSSQTGLSRVSNSFVYNQSGKSRITALGTSYLTGLSRITNSAVYNESGRSRITNSSIYFESGKSRITSNIINFNTGLSRVSNSYSTNISGVAKIGNFYDSYITGKSRITAQNYEDNTGVSRITNNYIYYETGKSRIQVTNFYFETGLARVTASSTVYESGKSRIANTYSYFTQGVSKIGTVATFDYNQSGLASIRQFGYNSISGFSRISSSLIYNESGLARITKQNSEDQTGASRIQNSYINYESGKARLQSTQIYFESGRSRISNTYINSISGSSKISETKTSYQSGLSRLSTVNVTYQNGVSYIDNGSFSSLSIRGVAKIKKASKRIFIQISNKNDRLRLKTKSGGLELKSSINTLNISN